MSSSLSSKKKITLGYYPLRGKCQICRLLCEYLHLPYTNLFFTPQSWKQYKKTNTKGWEFAELPFLQDEDFFVTQPYPIAMYLIKKANREDLLGKTLMDRIKIEAFIFEMDIVKMMFAQIIQLRDLSQEEIMQKLSDYFEANVKQKLYKLEEECCGEFYFEYLSIIDFYIYEIVYFLTAWHSPEADNLPKIKAIANRIYNLPAIKAYENSPKAVTDTCPLKFCQKWKEKCSKSSCQQKQCC